MRVLYGLAFGAIFSFSGSILSGGEFKLPPNCTLPFDNIATKPDPASSCGFDGSGTGGAALTQDKVLEDHAKNDFCAGMSNVTTVNFSILKQMQLKAPPKGPLATSRNSLHNFFTVNGGKIGEGSVVRLLAFVKEAHISDCELGEDVNCKTKGVPANDIHIPLVDPTKPNARNLSECTSVTAEMSPHFRPAKWSELDLKTPTYPVRVTGPLFYDNSHEPCQMKGGKLTGPGPQRISLWEIHPVYAFDVCTSANPAKCDVTSDSADMWVPYDQWVDANPDKVEATGKKQREECGGSSGARRPTRGRAKKGA
jgi:hypothetical protein